MRVVIESERTLVVESSGRFARMLLLFVILPIILIHAAVLIPQMKGLIATAQVKTAYANATMALFVYALLIYLNLGPLRDRVTVTFHGLKCLVSIEHLFPLGYTVQQDIPFQAFEQFEVSLPNGKGFCRLRMKDGKARMLFRVNKGDNYGALQRLDMITRKKTVMVER